ncbi:TfoX/Sxy family protein [Aquimarina sp. 2201CG5-10]|uniref:TfoX/Sxy family protein n=1 Tax=Aquimarina callyspongiae TaxID=3098150 RepID=UPI002AB4237E|nr:TfoX/Sxy family protein [Aquimarina sp. 2201CG5-10]MDY8137095.1 TfoX/Sxy family protein [Aquimarina sp. 2201CG5-10]
MAYNEYTADRIHQIFKEKKVNYYAKKMMGGLCFMVDDKMCCGIHYDKKKETDLLMARIGEKAFEKAILKEGCQPMDFTGRPMKGYVFVTPDGFDLDVELEYWIELCLEFNPLAKRSKKKK